MPLVLAHNEVVAPEYQWDDVEGVHYHYPSKYRGKVRSGEPFVYYRGVHRADGKRRPAEYVGAGVIGDIWADPSRPKAWYCAIEDYERFASPVLSKVDGVTREQIEKNMWRDGVRMLEPTVYQEIVLEALGGPLIAKGSVSPTDARLAELKNLIVPQSLNRNQAPGGGGSGGGGSRRSPRAKAIGDWAEMAALAYIQSSIPECFHCTHRAALGEKPGWDFDYQDAKGNVNRVEVKGTVGSAFATIDLTANEMKAATAHGENYWLCLVANCETDRPAIQLIQDPMRKIADGEWTANPAIYSVRFSG